MRNAQNITLRGFRRFTKVTESEVVKSLNKKGDRKGRSEALINERNKLMIWRFYFYAKYRGLRYEAVINSLSLEFFLSPATIMDVIVKKSHLPGYTTKEMPSLKELQQQYDFLNWKN